MAPTLDEMRARFAKGKRVDPAPTLADVLDAPDRIGPILPWKRCGGCALFKDHRGGKGNCVAQRPRVVSRSTTDVGYTDCDHFHPAPFPVCATCVELHQKEVDGEPEYMCARSGVSVALHDGFACSMHAKAGAVPPADGCTDCRFSRADGRRLFCILGHGTPGDGELFEGVACVDFLPGTVECRDCDAFSFVGGEGACRAGGSMAASIEPDQDATGCGGFHPAWAKEKREDRPDPSFPSTTTPADPPPLGATPPDTPPDVPPEHDPIWTRLENHHGTSHKFWQVAVHGRFLLRRWGRIGTAGQKKVEDLSTRGAAETRRRDLLDQKRSKGYEHV